MSDSTVTTEPRGKADAQVVNDLIAGAINDAAGAGVFEKLALCYNTRRMLWEGQTDDGLLPALSRIPKERKVFTWEGAPDTGIPYADEVVEEQALIRESAWNRGEVRLGPRELDNEDGVKDEDKASSWQTAMEFWLDVDRHHIGYQIGLFNTCVEECGYGLLHVGCQRQIRAVKSTVTLDDLLKIVVAQAMESVGGQLPEGAELPPEMVAAVQSQAQMGLEMMMVDSGDTRLQELLLAHNPAMPRTEARIAARELRKTGVKATYYAPQDDGYTPFVAALVPFINCIHGTDLSGAGKCWWFSIPVRLCEADLRVRAASEQWDAAFLDAVLLHENEFLISQQTWSSRVPQWALSGAGVGQITQPTEEKFYEVVYVWRQMPDGDGRPMVFHTLVHPSINDMVGFHECSGLAGLPLHAQSREKVLYAVQSRGIPEIAVKAGMPTIKVLMDAEGARAQLGSNPPLNRSVEQHVSIAPGQQMFQKRGGGENKFMDIPGADQGALNMLDRIREQLDRRFFRHEKTDPDIKRLYRESIALSAAGTIREVVRLLWKVMQQHVETLKVGRIAGRTVDLELSRDSMQGEVDVKVEFNVDGLSVEGSDRMMEFGTKLMQMGAENVDINELVNMIARMENPDLARRIILPADVAAKKVSNDQNNRIAQMSAGVPMSYDERATAPQLRLQVLQAWMEQPTNVQRAQQDPVWAKSMQDEITYLQRQIQQYQKNAVTGRTLMPAAQ